MRQGTEKRRDTTFRDWSKSIGGWAGAERGGQEVLSFVQGVGHAIFSLFVLRGWVTLFYYIDRHTILILTIQLTTVDI